MRLFPGYFRTQNPEIIVILNEVNMHLTQINLENEEKEDTPTYKTKY